MNMKYEHTEEREGGFRRRKGRNEKEIEKSALASLIRLMLHFAQGRNVTSAFSEKGPRHLLITNECFSKPSLLVFFHLILHWKLVY